MAKQLSRPRNARLNLITDQQDVVFIAERTRFLQVVIIRDNDARVALDRLDEEGSEMRPSGFESSSKCCLVVVKNRFICAGDRAADVGDQRTVIAS